MHQERRRGKPRSRVLYWYRTPPGVKVGRSGLDEEAIRLIEEHNPDVEFDWTRILKGQGPPPDAKPQPETRKHRSPVPSSTRDRRQEPDAPPALDPVQSHDPRDRQTEVGTPAAASGAPPEAHVHAGLIEGDPASVADFAAESSAVLEGPPSEGPTAAHRRIGSEGVSRLRARHAELLTRVAERITDPEQQEKLKAEAERLNPDTWVTDEEVRIGLENYEAVFESLRAVVGTRRRRRRGRRRVEDAELSPSNDRPDDGRDGEDTSEGDGPEPGSEEN